MKNCHLPRRKRLYRKCRQPIRERGHSFHGKKHEEREVLWTIFAPKTPSLVKPAEKSTKPAPFSAIGALAEKAVPREHLVNYKCFRRKPCKVYNFSLETSATKASCFETIHKYLSRKLMGSDALCSRKTKLNCKLKPDSCETFPKCHENSSQYREAYKAVPGPNLTRAILES